MIYPCDSSRVTNAADGRYRIVAWNGSLPAFDPLPTFKTALLSPSSIKQFNRFTVGVAPFLGTLGVAGISVRIATFATPAPVGCILAPVSVLLQTPGLIVATAHMRIEYMKILTCTFDFWFIESANTLWAITFCAVLRDLRVILVLFCWVDFTFWLLEEAYMRNSRLIVGVALMQWTFYAMLTVMLSLGLVDDVQHYKLITAGGRTLSTDDILSNLLVTMTMLSLRNVYRRYKHLNHQQNKRMKSLGYRCKIALSILSTQVPSAYDIIAPKKLQQPDRTTRGTKLPVKEQCVSSHTHQVTKRPLLQMVLAVETIHIDPRNTVWPRIGALTPLAIWELIALHVCGGMGGVFATLSLFLPTNTLGARVSGVCGLVTSALYCGVHTCCSQRQLLKRVVTSFHFLFLEFQIIAAGVCVAEMFEWKWAPTCGVGTSLLLGFPILSNDALTPVMKHRLRYKHWIIINGIVSYILVEIMVLLDVLMWGKLGLHDRVIFDLTIFTRHTKFYAVPFFLSRIVTITVWSARNAFVALTRPDDNALILLRGEVDFDYEGWKKQFMLGPQLR